MQDTGYERIPLKPHDLSYNIPPPKNNKELGIIKKREFSLAERKSCDGWNRAEGTSGTAIH